jgi:uncharacterized protein (TIGR03067 family)
MRYVAFLAGLAAAGCGDAAAPGPSDRDRFQGYWRLIVHEKAGAAVANEVAGIRFRDDCFILWAADPSRSFDGRYSLEPHHNPPRIVFHEDPPWLNEPLANGMGGEKTEEERPWRERRIVGIYKFDDKGRLTLSFIRGSDSPPWRFRSTDHRECVLMVLEKGER